MKNNLLAQLKELEQQREDITSQLDRLKDMTFPKDYLSENELKQLSLLFDNVNLDKLSEINKYHRDICDYMDDNIQDSINELNEELAKINKEIKKIEINITKTNDIQNDCPITKESQKLLDETGNGGTALGTDKPTDNK